MAGKCSLNVPDYFFFSKSLLLTAHSKQQKISAFQGYSYYARLAKEDAVKFLIIGIPLIFAVIIW